MSLPDVTYGRLESSYIRTGHDLHRDPSFPFPCGALPLQYPTGWAPKVGPTLGQEATQAAPLQRRLSALPATLLQHCVSRPLVRCIFTAAARGRCRRHRRRHLHPNPPRHTGGGGICRTCCPARTMAAAAGRPGAGPASGWLPRIGGQGRPACPLWRLTPCSGREMASHALFPSTPSDSVDTPPP